MGLGVFAAVCSYRSVNVLDRVTLQESCYLICNNLCRFLKNVTDSWKNLAKNEVVWEKTVFSWGATLAHREELSNSEQYRTVTCPAVLASLPSYTRVANLLQTQLSSWRWRFPRAYNGSQGPSITRKPCCLKETARCRAVLFGLKFAENIHYKFKSSQAPKAMLQSSKQRRKTEFHAKWPFKIIQGHVFWSQWKVFY